MIKPPYKTYPQQRLQDPYGELVTDLNLPKGFDVFLRTLSSFLPSPTQATPVGIHISTDLMRKLSNKALKRIPEHAREWLRYMYKNSSLSEFKPSGLEWKELHLEVARDKLVDFVDLMDAASHVPLIPPAASRAIRTPKNLRLHKRIALGDYIYNPEQF